MRLNSILIELRQKSNTTKKELAKNLNVSEKTIKLWEEGKSKPRLKNLISLARYFRVSLDYLLEIKIDNIFCQNSKKEQ